MAGTSPAMTGAFSASLSADQPLFTHLVKGSRRIAGIADARSEAVFRQRWNWKLTAHAAVACEIARIMACLAAKSSFCEELE
jgi:hypothetical protein